MPVADGNDAVKQANETFGEWSYSCRGVVYQEMGQYDAAVADLQKAIEMRHAESVLLRARVDEIRSAMAKVCSVLFAKMAFV